jgi:hypothetical protein
VTIRVIGVPAGLPGWDTPVDFLAWRDPHVGRVTGGLIADHLGALTNDVTVAPERTVTTKASHTFDAVGYVRTSHGVVTTAVHRRLGDDSVHTWGEGENPDALKATWTDESWTLSGARVTHDSARYVIDGSITVSPDNRLTTTITMTDAGIGYDDTYRGEASFTLGVPREQRHATGTSEERYRAGRYDRTIRTVNGFVV